MHTLLIWAAVLLQPGSTVALRFNRGNKASQGVFGRSFLPAGRLGSFLMKQKSKKKTQYNK